MPHSMTAMDYTTSYKPVMYDMYQMELVCIHSIARLSSDPLWLGDSLRMQTYPHNNRLIIINRINPINQSLLRVCIFFH